MARDRTGDEAPEWGAVAEDVGISPDPARCRTCAMILDARKDYRRGDTSTPVQHCYGCGAHDSGVLAFTTDTPCIEDRGKRMCAECRMPAIIRRSTCSHEWARGRRHGEHCERCETEITGHRELFREYMRRMAERAVTL